MAGLNLSTGLNGRVSGSVIPGLYGGYGGGTPGSASVPAATQTGEGPATITQQAWGVPPATGRPGRNVGIRAAAISTLALVALGFIWWTLPR